MFWRIFTDFPFGIMISELLFAAFFERRKLFWLRVLTALPVWVIYAWIAESGTPQERMAEISLSEERREKTSRDETSTAMGIE